MTLRRTADHRRDRPKSALRNSRRRPSASSGSLQGRAARRAAAGRGRRRALSGPAPHPERPPRRKSGPRRRALALLSPAGTAGRRWSGRGPRSPRRMDAARRATPAAALHAIQGRSAGISGGSLNYVCQRLLFLPRGYASRVLRDVLLRAAAEDGGRRLRRHRLRVSGALDPAARWRSVFGPPGERRRGVRPHG